MSQSPKRPSLSEASEASQPLSNSTECEAGQNSDEPPPRHTEATSTQSKDGVTTAGLSPVPGLPTVLKAGDTLTQHHDPELGDRMDEPPQSQCTEQPACGEESAPEIQLAPSANCAISRSPKRSSFPDASDTLPKPKRHEREPPGVELESLRKAHTMLSPPGRDILVTEGLGLPDLCGGEDEHAPKQIVDPPPSSDSSRAMSYPSLASKLSATTQLPPLIDEDAAPGEPTSPSHPSLAPKLSATPHLPPLIDEGSALGEATSPSLPVQTHANDLTSKEHQAPRKRLHFVTYNRLVGNDKATIPELWSRFKSAVEVFAMHCLPKKCSWDELPTTYQAEVRTWASDPQDYLNSAMSLDVNNFYAAWLFRLLDRHLFSGEDLDKWDGSDWRSFGTIWASGKAHLSKPNGLFAVKYHHWRNLSVQTLADMYPERPHVDPLWLRTKIEDWMKHLPFASEKEQIESKWEELIESAIDMDSLIITARQDIKMRLSDPATHKDHSFPLVESKMTSYLGSMTKASDGLDNVVDFVIFPTLLAYGNVVSKTYGAEESPTESVLCPFGSSWDEVFVEINMLVYLR